MKLFRVLLLTGAAYAVATQAHAEVVSFSIFSALYSIGVSGAVANAISLIAIPALAIGASLVFGKQSSASVTASDAKSTFETSESQVIEGIGRVRIGGLNAFGNSDGSTRARLICRLQGPIDAVEEYYIGGREVVVDTDGSVSSPPWARAGGSWCNWQDKKGDGSETAWSGLMSLFPALWTSDHRARGIAQSQIIWYNPGLSEDKYFTLYQGGIPDTEQLIRASKIYDPRTGATAWSDNGVLACAHILQRDPVFTDDTIDWGLIASEANKADVLVATRTGTEKRSRAWGVWGWETSRSEVMQQLMDSVGVELRTTDVGKVWFQLIDDDHASEVDFGPRDGVEVSWRSGPEAVERPNILRLSYYSPERNYESAEIDLIGKAWASVDDEVARYGPKYLDINLLFCPSASQAQRIGRRKFAQARGDTGSISTDMAGLAAWGLLYAEVALPDLGDVLPVRMEAPRVNDDNGTVEIPFSVWPTLTAWNPATDEAAAPDPIPDFEYESDLTTPNAPNDATQITYPDGGKEFRVGYSLPAQTIDTIECTYRSYTSGLPNSWTGMTESSNVCAFANVDLTGSTIDARVRVFYEDDGSYFSPLLNAGVGPNNTACGAPTATGGITTPDGGIPTLNLSVTVPELRAASVTLERSVGGVWSVVSHQNIRPGQTITFSSAALTGSSVTTYWRLQTRTSNGTGGPYATYAYTTADTSGGSG